jgi:hypothetical protein
MTTLLEDAFALARQLPDAQHAEYNRLIGR